MMMTSVGSICRVTVNPSASAGIAIALNLPSGAARHDDADPFFETWLDGTYVVGVRDMRRRFLCTRATCCEYAYGKRRKPWPAREPVPGERSAIAYRRSERLTAFQETNLHPRQVAVSSSRTLAGGPEYRWAVARHLSRSVYLRVDQLEVNIAND